MENGGRTTGEEGARMNEIYVHIYYGHSPHDSSTSGARRKNDQRKVLQQCTTIS